MPIRTFAASCAAALSLGLLAGCGGTGLLRQDIATYWSLASQHAPSSDAAVKAEGDCSSIKAPLAKAFGGS